MKNVLRTIVFASALGLVATAMPSMMAMPFTGAQDQDHHNGSHEQGHPDYSNNRFYKVGNSEGYKDYKHETQRKEHNHNYRNDEDRQAHDYGYQEGLQANAAIPMTTRITKSCSSFLRGCISRPTSVKELGRTDVLQRWSGNTVEQSCALKWSRRAWSGELRAGTTRRVGHAQPQALHMYLPRVV